MWKIFGSIIGIGGNFFKNKAKLKELKQIQSHEIIKAQTMAVVDRIMNNTESDNQIDLITARNKKYTWKDEIVTYLFLTPVFIAAITPFIMAYETSKWGSLNEYTKQSWQSLNELPDWYMYVLFAVVVDVLGFRSFMRKLIEKYTSKWSVKNIT
ncbi:MAG: hypothetical protein JKY98_03950 [Gammaproteobacteria bacterium]|nr:hypothetical protein [Gammaproteobacteria bacterium]